MLKIALTANSEGVFGWGVKIMLKIAFTATLRVCLVGGGGFLHMELIHGKFSPIFTPQPNTPLHIKQHDFLCLHI